MSTYLNLKIFFQNSKNQFKKGIAHLKKLFQILQIGLGQGIGVRIEKVKLKFYKLNLKSPIGYAIL